MAAPTSPRRFRFGLRTMFVLVTVVAIMSAGYGWIRQSRDWIQQRQALLLDEDLVWTEGSRVAPGGLWLLGEKGVSKIHPRFEYCDSDRIRQLFPEAQVMSFDYWRAALGLRGFASAYSGQLGKEGVERYLKLAEKYEQVVSEQMLTDDVRPSAPRD